MSNNNLTIDLKARKDIDGNTYYIGKLKAPMLIDCKQGVVFLVFVSDPENEALQIAPMDTKNNFEDNFNDE
jgi:hypothetical protein